jgi:hypothetical protein
MVLVERANHYDNQRPLSAGRIAMQFRTKIAPNVLIIYKDQLFEFGVKNREKLKFLPQGAEFVL